MFFSKTLLAWYDLNRRDLPWRHTKDPYRIWLSEIMLQQTRVDQGLSYYLRFLELFPTVFDLAQASEDEVLKAWQGLGYYSRARNLHATAKHVVVELGGNFPTSAAELKLLKGVGEYTAAAIASFCHAEVVPVVDGNVMRVVSRILAIELPIDKPEGRAVILDALRSWIPSACPDTFNQAIMEFGALHCTPKNPSCSTCVFLNVCDGRRKGLVPQLPKKSSKIMVKDVWMYYLVCNVDEQILMRRRHNDGIWKGLYDFPSIDSDYSMDAALAVQQWMGSVPVSLGFVVNRVSSEQLHLLSHRRIHAFFIELEFAQSFLAPAHCAWVEVSNVHQLGVSRLVDRYLQQR